MSKFYDMELAQMEKEIETSKQLLDLYVGDLESILNEDYEDHEAIQDCITDVVLAYEEQVQKLVHLAQYKKKYYGSPSKK